MIYVTMLFQFFNAIIMLNNDKDRHAMMTAFLKVKAIKKATIKLTTIYSMTILAYLRAVFICNLLCSIFIHVAKITKIVIRTK